MTPARTLCTIVLSLTVLVTAVADLSGYALIAGYTAEDELEHSSRVTIGEEIYEVHETMHPYTGSGIVWEQKFSWPDAGYISIHFSEFDLAPGDFVEITSPDEEYGYIYQGKGKVVRRGEEVLSEFWATHIPGEAAIVRLYSSGSNSAYGFTIDRWARGFEKEIIEDILGLGYEGDVSAICGNDDKEWAPCYSGDIYDKARAVARLMIGGVGACTGWLVGSEGHLMTNYHCISTQSEADNTDYEFMAEGETCETDCQGWGACPGVVAASSGDIISSDYDLDYTLILLDSDPTPEYGYLQLREELPEVGETLFIPQHPGAWGKQIAVYDDQSGGDCNVYSLDESPCIGGPGDIGYMCDTNNGSSGSPVIAVEDLFVIALHHCANCPNRGVPIPPIIADIGEDLLPADAIGGRDEIRGTVTNATTGAEMDSVLIEVPVPYQFDYTDQYGFYTVKADFPESVQVSATFVGYEAETEWVDIIQEGVTYHNVQMSAINPGHLAGYVTDLDTGEGIGGELGIYYEGLELTSTTVDDETGFYILEVPEGSWVVTVDPVNPYINESEPGVVIGVNDTTRLDFELAALTQFSEVSGAAGILGGGFGGGVSFVDYDGDGDDDIFVVNLFDDNRMYMNLGGTFEEVAATIGLAGEGRGFAGVWGDYDRDNDLDCFVSQRNGFNALFRNDDGVFTDVALTAGVGGEEWDSGQGAMWIDVDRDGRLDIYVANKIGANRLFRNRGNGTFEELGSLYGVDDQGAGWGVSAADYDNDGDTDIYVVNGEQENTLLRNDGGFFTDVSSAAGVDDAGTGRGSCWADVDADGDMDLFVANSGPDAMYRNDGGVFTDVTATAGLGDTRSANSCSFFDYDRDGDQDLIVATGTRLLMYINDGAGAFTEVGDIIGVAGGLGVGLACGDYDGDDDLDVFVARSNNGDDLLFENAGNLNSWLTVDLQGWMSNRDGIGARVEAWIGGQVSVHDVTAGSGLYSQNSITTELGLARESVIDSLIVRWPSGKRTKLVNVSTEQSLSLTEPGTYKIPALLE